MRKWKSSKIKYFAPGGVKRERGGTVVEPRVVWNERGGTVVEPRVVWNERGGTVVEPRVVWNEHGGTVVEPWLACCLEALRDVLCMFFCVSILWCSQSLDHP
jgi:hypothetical protein